MRRRVGTILLVALISAFNFNYIDAALARSRSSGICGHERWDVKTGTDNDSGKIQGLDQVDGITVETDLDALPAPIHKITIAEMIKWKAPYKKALRQADASRFSPQETIIWVLDAKLIKYKQEADSDFHLVLEDENGKTIIAEIPSPSCVGASSPFKSLISAARSDFVEEIAPPSHGRGQIQDVDMAVRVVGVGFFDFLHGQTGVAPNGIELHPVLKIMFFD